jgi:hypothetical protein
MWSFWASPHMFPNKRSEEKNVPPVKNKSTSQPDVPMKETAKEVSIQQFLDDLEEMKKILAEEATNTTVLKYYFMIIMFVFEHITPKIDALSNKIKKLEEEYLVFPKKTKDACGVFQNRLTPLLNERDEINRVMTKFSEAMKALNQLQIVSKMSSDLTASLNKLDVMLTTDEASFDNTPKSARLC